MRERTVAKALFGLSIVLEASAAAHGAGAETDPRALLRASVVAMGSTAPSTSDTVGTITITEGSTTRSGSFRSRTRGLDESNDAIDAQVSQELVYSGGDALEKRGAIKTTLSKELAASTYSSQFPLVVLQRLLSEPDNVFEYLGPESVEGRSTEHVRIRNTFASRPDLQPISEVTVRDVWIDSSTRLPVKLALRRHDGLGATYPVPVEFVYDDFRAVAGRRFPFRVLQRLNGSPWASIVITSVAFDTPLADDVFSVEGGE